MPSTEAIDHAGGPLLVAADLHKRFGAVQAVAGASLSIATNEVHGLVGPNGCGKSTLLGMVSGLIRPDSGTVAAEGIRLESGYRDRQRRGIVMIPQELALAPRDTVWQSVVLGAEPGRYGLVDRRCARRRAAAAFEMLGHPIDVDLEVGSLGAAEKRLVTLARGAAWPDARLLILDEPTAGLPFDDAARVIEAMRNLLSDERAIVLVSHHIEEVVGACRRVTVMRDGRTVRVLAGAELSKDNIVDLLLAGKPLEETGRGTAVSAAGDVLATMKDVEGRELRGLSLTVRRGEVVGIAGILGSGATEVIRMLTGQSQPLSGEVSVGSKGLRPSNPHRARHAGVGYVSGDRSSLVMPSMTVAEHVALPNLKKLSKWGFVHRRAQRRLVRWALDGLSVKGGQDDPMSALSGGNQQRALMARWLGDETELLVASDPTVGVDLAGRSQILTELRRLASTQGVVVSGEPDELSALCDRILCLRRGRLAADLRVEDATEAGILNAIT
jgi:monosaccharide-transporting ATPase